MPSKIWNIAPKYSDDLIEQLLYNRGIKTAKEKLDFLNPNLEEYKQDMDITGIKNSQRRVKKAIEKSELIFVYADYDVDGVCSAAILYKALSSLGAKVLPYIPHREKEGYGMSNEGLEFARDSGASLVITVDNGIVALDQAKYAKEIGLDLIITDHHIPLDEKPQAYEIVHSTKMCGAGVAWCMVKDMVSENAAKELLELVSIATVCDLILLKGVSRPLVKEGLKILNRTKNIGLLNLIEECGITTPIGTYEIGHIIGPRLNAIGRMEHAIDALRLLCTKDPLKAKRLAKLLCDVNQLRQQKTLTAIEEARAMVVKSPAEKINILYSQNWLPGIIGLVAARITEEYYRPAIAISVGETKSKGSARSVNGINIVEVIRQTSDLLIDVGGHSGAAGFSILNENIEKFRERLLEIVDSQPDGVEQTLEIDAELTTDHLTKGLVGEIAKLEPFGFGNQRPLFATKNMLVSDIRTVGNGKHLKFKADDIDAIAFGMGDYSDKIKNRRVVDLAYNLEINQFNGREILQLKVKDIL